MVCIFRIECHLVPRQLPRPVQPRQRVRPGLAGCTLAFLVVALAGSLVSGVATAADAIPTISTFAGVSDPNSDEPYGDGGPATEANILAPQDVAVDQNGNVYIADYFGQKVWVVDSTGVIHSAAGGQDETTSPSDGAVATEVRIGGARGVAVGEGGVLYIAVGGDVIYRVTPNGLIYRHVGVTGMVAHDVDAGPNGSIFISDTGNNLVRKVSRDGVVSTVAGNGQRGNAGDGGPATEAQLDGPLGVLAMPDGGFLVSSNERVRRVAPDGTISTFAGGGGDVGAGDALAVKLAGARGLARDALGRVYVADLGHHLVRRISANGAAEVVVGHIVDESGATAGYAGDGGPATEALIGMPRGIAIHGRSLYVADQKTLHVRVVEPVHEARGLSDFNGDGASDIAWRNGSSGANAIWLGAAADEPQRIPGVRNVDWEIVATGDFDNDGISDLFWRNLSTGANAMWPGASPSSTPAPSVTQVAWQVAGAGDFDGDGYDDLFWRDAETGANAIWPSGQPGRAVTGVRNLDWHVVGIGDFNGDRRDDVLWRNRSTGRNVIWRNADFADQQAVVGVSGTNWQIAGVSDFNADFVDDVLWRNAASGANVVWLGAVWADSLRIAAVADPAWQVAALGDYDSDGAADILWRHAATGANVIWHAGAYQGQQRLPGVPDQAWKVVPAD